MGEKTAPNTLEKGCKIVEELGYKYWISAGTLLGIHRDGKLIKHDTDLDIEILGEVNLYELIERMEGFELIRTITHNNKWMQITFIDTSNNVIFDIYVFYKEDNLLINTNELGMLYYPGSNFEKLTTVEFNGFIYPCPERDWYCQFRYGDN
jgi:hypothetical protein